MFSDREEAIRRLICVMRQVVKQQESNSMNARDLMYWLQGEFELNGVKGLTESKVKQIHHHVQLAIAEEVRLDRMKEMALETENLKAKAALRTMGVNYEHRDYGPPAGC